MSPLRIWNRASESGAHLRAVWRWSSDWIRFYHSRYGGAVWSAIVALGAAYVVYRMCADSRSDLGTVPSWISAFGAIATCGGVVFAVLTYRQQQRKSLEEAASQARLVTASFPPGPEHDGSRTWWVDIKNNSSESVRSVRVHAFQASVQDGARPVWLRAFEMVEIGDHKVLLDDLPLVMELKSGELMQTRWRANPSTPKAPSRRAPVVQYTLTDANGRSWLIADNHEPELFTRPSRRRRYRGRILK